MRYGDAPRSTALAEAVRLHKQGLLEGAMRAYRSAPELAAGVPDAALNLGMVCLLAGRPGEARRALATAETGASSDARALKDLGLAWRALGDLDAAACFLDRALALDPSHVGSWLAAAEVRLERGDTRGAREAAVRAVLLAPLEAAAHVVAHHVLFDDDRGAADAALGRALELDPAWSLPRLLAACARATDGDVERAREVLGGGHVDPGLARLVDHAARACRSVAMTTSRAGLLRRALELAPRRGLALEFGVFHGASTRVLAAHLAAIGREGAPDGPALVAFDSFEGLPTAWLGLPAGAFTTSGEPPPLPSSVELRIGRFEDTLSAFLGERTDDVAFAHVDADLYESARVVLSALEPRLVDGAIVVFDELFGNATWEEDEHRALTELVERTGWSAELLLVNWVTGQGVVRLGRAPTTCCIASAAP